MYSHNTTMTKSSNFFCFWIQLRHTGYLSLRTSICLAANANSCISSIMQRKKEKKKKKKGHWLNHAT